MKPHALLTCLLALAGTGCLGTAADEFSAAADGGVASTESELGDPIAALKAELVQEVNADGVVSPTLGSGRNMITNEFRAQCVQSWPRWGTSGDSKVVFDRSVTESEISSSLGVSGSAKASFGLFGGSARASFTRATRSTSRSINLMYQNQTTVNSAIFDDTAFNWIVPKNDPQWLTKCGDGFVQEMKLGGELYILVRMDFATESEKNAFDTAVNGTYGFGLASGSLKLSKAAQSFKGRATIHLEAYQNGGASEKLPNIFSGATIDGTRAAVDCSFDNLAACNTFLAQALAYATGKGANDFPQTLKANPAALKYIVRDWQMIGAGKATNPVPAAVTTARNQLFLMYRQNVDVLNRWDALNRASFFGGDPVFRDTAGLYAWVASANVSLLEQSVKRCFDDLSVPPTQAQVDLCVWYAQPNVLTQIGYTNVSAAIAAMDVKLKPTPNLGRSDYFSTVTPHSGYWGGWSAFSMCPAGQYVIGYRQRIEGYQGDGSGDDTGLNAIELICAPWNRGTQTTRLPHPGNWGTWYPPATCQRGPMSGMRIEIEGPQGSADDTAANNVVGMCVSGEEIQAGFNARTMWVTERGTKYCPAGTAVCGAQVRVEAPRGSGTDDTSLNGIALACCVY